MRAEGGKTFHPSAFILHPLELGSTSLTTDQDQNIVSEVRYLPYGEERWTNGGTPTDFGFTAQRNEAGFGLMDYNARYYSPRLGRFVSPDSIVPNPLDSQAFNRYAYVNNNPVNHTDPSGHGDPLEWQAESILGGGGRAITVGNGNGGGEVVLVTVALIAIPLAVEAGKTVRDIITPFPGTAPDLGPLPGFGGDELNPSDSGGVIPGPPSNGEFTGPWVSSDPAELQQPNNPSGFPADSGVPPLITLEARNLDFQKGFSRGERKMINNVVKKHGFNLAGIKLWRGSGSPSNFSASWGQEGMTFYDNAFSTQEELAKSIFEELQHKNQNLTEWGGGNVQTAEEEAENNLNKWWKRR